MTQEARLTAELLAAPVDRLRELPDVALALVFAAAQVDRGAPAPAELRALMVEGYALRELLLSVAAGLATAGLLPERDVARIREGRGGIDAAQDNVDLGALFGAHAAALKGKSPVTAAQVKRAAELGSRLLQVLKPDVMKKGDKTSKEVRAAALVRDQMWTLLDNRWNDLWRCGAYGAVRPRRRQDPRPHAPGAAQGQAQGHQEEPASGIAAGQHGPGIPPSTHWPSGPDGQDRSGNGGRTIRRRPRWCR